MQFFLKGLISDNCACKVSETTLVCTEIKCYLFSRLRRARDQLQGKSDECSRVKDENNELDDEITQLKESHQ